MLETMVRNDGGIQENLMIVKSLLAEKRQEPDGPRKWDWLDFLEINVMTELSNLVQYIYYGETVEELPEPARIYWRNPKHEQEYYKLWKEFLSANSQSRVVSKLERMFLLWKHNASAFTLREAI